MELLLHKWLRYPLAGLIIILATGNIIVVTNTEKRTLGEVSLVQQRDRLLQANQDLAINKANATSLKTAKLYATREGLVPSVNVTFAPQP